MSSDAFEDEPTRAKAKVIKAVDYETVHRICSGQVVLSLSTAVKELVENSLDGGATKIEIELNEYGSQSIQVADDGEGITKENYKGLTLKHHTSKIQEFSDLTSVETFGFRGEALSSLCALSHLKVLTRTDHDDLATELEYDANGHVVSERSQARPRGTTVTLAELFHSMPVRRKEFLRNIKKEFGKMVQVLNAYCLISKGIRIICHNTVGKSRRMVLQTRGKLSTRDNILDLFGPKVLDSLKPLKLTSPSEEDLSLYSLKPDDPLLNNLPSVECLVSTCAHGEGRSSTDRQFFYINSRPCDPTKVSKLVNESYRQWNRHQHPFVFLNVETEREGVDVNVTPDKRKVLIEKEKFLLAVMRASLRETFQEVPAEFQCNRAVFDSFRTAQKENVEEKDEDGAGEPEEEEEEDGQEFSLASLKRSFSASSCGNDVKKSKKIKRQMKSQSSLDVFVKKSSPPKADEVHADDKVESFGQEFEFKKPTAIKDFVKAKGRRRSDMEEQSNVVRSPEKCLEIVEINPKPQSRKTVTVPFSISRVGAKKGKSEKSSSDQYRKFLARISPEEGQSAEKELSRNIDKESFRRMEIHGQFNLGFIIASLDKDDLFIIDQHATDEKYNYERLQGSNLLEAQKMLVPQRLELTAANETILLDNLDTFRANGFDFAIDEGADRDRVRLRQIPHYRNWVFGKEDVEELLFMLSDGPSDCGSRLFRPSRVDSMLASRACRTSVMIGTALSRADMRRLVDHMAELNQPWNCPHGRPTMRHLVNLNLIK